MDAFSCSSIASAIVPPIIGSVPEPNSSMKSNVRGPAFFRKCFMLTRWELYVLKSFSMDCSSPISSIISEKMPNEDAPPTGTGSPHCNMYESIAAVFRQTLLPPAFGPEISNMRFSESRRKVVGTISRFSFLSVRYKRGCFPRTMSRHGSSCTDGMMASIRIANFAFALIKSSSAITCEIFFKSSAYGRNSQVSS